MHNSIYKLLKQVKKAAAMQPGSFLPPEPLPNSIKAKQLEQQEMAEQQAQAQPEGSDPQLAQMQKAQQDAVNQLQQAQQQLSQTQAELQNVQMQSQQQQQATQMQAQQDIQKAQMDAQYELQAEKIKNQQKLLSMQEKYMRSAGKAKPDQNHILSSQLKRVVKKVNSIKTANAPSAAAAVPGAAKAFGGAAAKTLGKAVPFAGAAISGASALSNLNKGNYLSAGLDALGGAASFIPILGIPLSIGAGLASNYFEKPEQTQPASGMSPELYQTGGLATPRLATPQPTPQPQSWDARLSPADRFSVLNQAQNMYKGANSTLKEVEYPDIRKFMKNPPPAGEYIPSPIPLLQAGFKQHEFAQPTSRQQGYGPLGNFIKQLIFQVGLPMVGIRNPLQPDFSRVYGSLRNNEAYKFVPPNSF